MTHTVCFACAAPYDVVGDEGYVQYPLCADCKRLPCFACGKTYAEHLEQLAVSGARPRMPCLGLRAHYLPARAVRARAVCERCATYRLALRTIADVANDNGTNAGALGDLARIALLVPEAPKKAEGT